MEFAGQSRVLLVGWDAAEWRIVSQLAGRGLMPNVAGLLARGVGGTLAARSPLLSPTCWMNIATGVHATRHGVVTGSELAPDGAALQAVGRSACAAPSFWSIAAAAGVPCHVINFPASHPAEPTGGVSISNYFPLEDTTDHAAAVHPPELLPVFQPMRVRPVEIDIASFLTLVPDAAKVDRKKDHRLALLARILAHSATVHATATWAMQQVPWRLAAVCYTGLHQISHAFMAFHPPARRNVNAASFEIYQHVVTAAYQFHDMMLGRLLDLAGRETNVILVSDHGFHSDHLRPELSAPTTEAMLAWHRPRALIVMAGPGIGAGGPPPIGSVFDIAPTILGLLNIKTPAQPPPNIQHSVAPKSVFAPDAAVEHLLALGYAAPEDRFAGLAARQIAQDRSFYMAVAFLDAGRADKALPALEKLTNDRPDRVEYQVGLAHAYFRLRRIEDCRRTAARLTERFPDSPHSLVAAAMLAISLRRAELALRLLQTAQKGAGADRSPTPAICAAMGQAYLRLRHYVEARSAFAAAIEMDDDCVEAHAGLSTVCLADGDPAAAAQSARRAMSLQPDVPLHHYQLAKALLAVADYAGARDLLLAALKLEPDSPPILRKLSGVYQRLGDLRAAHNFDLQAHLAIVNRRLMSKPRPGSGRAREAS